ncbi:MAG: hypothetical protein V7K47_07070 [Nostoc sp.]
MTDIDILRTELQSGQYASLVAAQNYPAIASVLNTKPLISNPAPQGQVPKQLSMENLFEAITPAEGLATFQYPGLLDRIELAVNNNDRPKIGIHFAMVKTFISLSSQTNLINLLAQTEPDPNWQSQIDGVSRAEELGIYPVNEMLVQSALN